MELAIGLGDMGSVLGGVAGVVGLVTGFFGLRRSKQANEAVRDANRIAQQAVGKSDESNLIAREANHLARGANELARSANEMAHAQDQRSTEIHDVEWDGRWVAPGVYELKASGEHVALDVTAVVTVDEEEKRTTSPRVEPGEALTLVFPEARRQYREERRRPASNVDWNFHSISERILWRTERGAPKEQEGTWNLSSLGEFG